MDAKEKRGLRKLERAIKANLVLCLVATKLTQGKRRNDFSWTEDGEAVYFGSRCDGATPDDNCGCARAFSGVKTAKATTTAIVATNDRKALIAERAAFWVKNWKMGQDEAQHEAVNDVQNMAVDLRDFPVGAVVEIRGDVMQTREAI